MLELLNGVHWMFMLFRGEINAHSMRSFRNCTCSFDQLGVENNPNEI